MGRYGELMRAPVRNNIHGNQAGLDGTAGTVEIFGVVVAAATRAVVTVHQRDGQPRKEEAEAHDDAIARTLHK